MKKFICYLIVLLYGLGVIAQKNIKEEPSFYLFNDTGDPCKIEDAKYLGVFEKLNDSSYLWKYYNFTGPLIAVETYFNKEMTKLQGYFAFFDTNGIIDSSGFISNGRKDKMWYYYSDSLTVWQTEEYNNGILIKIMDEAALKAKREDLKNYIDTSKFQPVEKESNFKGEGKAWIKYLQNNLQFPARATQLDKQGKVMVDFIINTNGYPSDILITQSVEYSLDEEAIRLIKQSPKWEPAIQKGKPVKAYRRQPITFALQ